MSVRRLPDGARRRARAAGALCALVTTFLLTGCEAAERCTSNAECPAGEVCSNEKNPLGAGVCIDPCTRHINTSPCIDAAVTVDAQPVDAGVDAAIDATIDATVTGGAP